MASVVVGDVMSSFLKPLDELGMATRGLSVAHAFSGHAGDVRRLVAGLFQARVLMGEEIEVLRLQPVENGGRDRHLITRPR